MRRCRKIISKQAYRLYPPFRTLSTTTRNENRYHGCVVDITTKDVMRAEPSHQAKRGCRFVGSHIGVPPFL